MAGLQIVVRDPAHVPELDHDLAAGRVHGGDFFQPSICSGAYRPGTSA
jgi:hypothetical protein